MTLCCRCIYKHLQISRVFVGFRDFFWPGSLNYGAPVHVFWHELSCTMCKDSRNFNKGAAKLEHLFEFVLVSSTSDCLRGASRSHQSATTNHASVIRRKSSPEKSNEAALTSLFSTDPDITSPNEAKKTYRYVAVCSQSCHIFSWPQMAGMIVRKHRSDRLQKFAARLTNKQQSVRGRVQNRCQRPVQSSVPPLISSFDFFKVSVRPKRTSPTSSLTPQYQSTVRPKTRISLQKSLSLVGNREFPMLNVHLKFPVVHFGTESGTPCWWTSIHGQTSIV